MISLRAWVLVFGLCIGLVSGLVSGPGWAGNDYSILRALELPAHEALIAGRERPGTELSQFESDGCSGGMSDVWRRVARQFEGFSQTFDSAPPWESCCVTHDRDYHDGVNAKDAATSFAARLKADQKLAQCVTEMGVTRRDELAISYDLSPVQVESTVASIGMAMYWAVRFGGRPCNGLPWRWGFGYADCSILGWSED